MGVFSFLTRKTRKPTRSGRHVGRSYRAPRAEHLKDGFMPRDTWERAPSSLATLQARARDLAHNNPYAARAVSILTSYITGTGIRVAVTGDDAYSKAYRAWSESPAVDYDGRLNLAGIQNLCCRMMIEAGEAFLIIRHVENDAGRLMPQFQAVDPALVASSASPKNPAHQVVSGVEIDPSTGRVTGYHFYKSFDPRSSRMETFFVATKDVVHLFETLYPGQIRGIPRGTQALIQASDMDQFVQTMLIKAKTEACLAVAVTVQDGEEYDDIGEVDESESDPLPETLSPGLIFRLRQGEDLKTVIPSGTGGYIDYVRISLQSIAISYRVTYSQISGDLAQANFSSLKSDLNLFSQGVDETRELYVTPVVARIERLFRADYELSEGRDVVITTTIVPPARSQIDPQKETGALISKLQSGLVSWSDAVLSTGKDPEEHLQQLVSERARLEKMGVNVSFIKQPDPVDDEDEAPANRDPDDSGVS